MIRTLMANTSKPIQIVTAGEALTRGMAVTLSAAGTVSKATAENGFGIVDVAPNYDGINSVITPNDDDFETIASGAKCLYIPCYAGDRYATNQITSSGLAAGDKLDAAAGLFTESTGGTEEWVYVGTYDDPTVTGMHIVQHL